MSSVTATRRSLTTLGSSRCTCACTACPSTQHPARTDGKQSSSFWTAPLATSCSSLSVSKSSMNVPTAMCRCSACKASSEDTEAAAASVSTAESTALAACMHSACACTKSKPVRYSAASSAPDGSRAVVADAEPGCGCTSRDCRASTKHPCSFFSRPVTSIMADAAWLARTDCIISNAARSKSESDSSGPMKELQSCKSASPAVDSTLPMTCSRLAMGCTPESRRALNITASDVLGVPATFSELASVYRRSASAQVAA